VAAARGAAAVVAVPPVGGVTAALVAVAGDGATPVAVGGAVASAPCAVPVDPPQPASPRTASGTPATNRRRERRPCVNRSSANRSSACFPFTHCRARAAARCRAAADAQESFPRSRRPVERTAGSILLVAGAADQLWPSGTFAGQLADRHAGDAGLPDTGAGGGSQPFGALGAFLVAIVAASGLAARLALRRR
jgi:hypothetical protein